jgi:thiol-disulfide isomerase/thioredoxin
MVCHRSTALVVLLGLMAWPHFDRIHAAEVAASEPADAATDAAQSGVASLPDDIEQLLALVQGIHFYDSSDPDEREAAERQRKLNRSYRQVEAALEKIHRIATPADKKLPGLTDALALRLVFRTAILAPGPRAGTAEEREQLFEEIGLMLASDPVPPRDAVAAARKVVSIVELTDPKRALALYRKYGAILTKCTGAKAAAAGAKMEGAARRLELVGKPLELRGTLVDGTPFDWARYRGKVVLIDVWATWCGPCVRALPHVNKCYQRYQGQGFDVVAISVDEDRVALDKFLAENPQPWANLYDGAFFNSPFAKQYGLPGIPAMILVDREGKVISINAQLPELEKLLADQFATESKEPID